MEDILHKYGHNFCLEQTDSLLEQPPCRNAHFENTNCIENKTDHYTFTSRINYHLYALDILYSFLQVTKLLTNRLKQHATPIKTQNALFYLFLHVPFFILNIRFSTSFIFSSCFLALLLFLLLLSFFITCSPPPYTHTTSANAPTPTPPTPP